MTFNDKILTELDVKEGCCCYCGRRLSEKPESLRRRTVDHIIPRSNGGTDHPSNLVPCCLGCNQWKKHHSLQRFLEDVELRMDLWTFSKQERRRRKHMHHNITLMILSMDRYKTEIFRYRKDLRYRA